jgi:hypothetical protein
VGVGTTVTVTLPLAQRLASDEDSPDWNKTGKITLLWSSKTSTLRQIIGEALTEVNKRKS